jgi:hypothetical protein
MWTVGGGFGFLRRSYPAFRMLSISTCAAPSRCSTRSAWSGSMRRQTPHSELNWRGTGTSLQEIWSRSSSYSARKAWLLVKKST